MQCPRSWEMMRLFCPALLVALAAVLASPSQAKSWLAVSPDPALNRSLSRLAQHRKAQGLEVSVANTGVAEAISSLGSPPDYLLIIGDDQLVPARRGHQYRWLSTQREAFPADPLFSDLDADGLPDFPVGRIPTRSPQLLDAVISKIIAYENRTLGIRDLNLPIWSGTPAYGKLMDETADWLLMSTIERHAPRWAQPWVITANPKNTLNAWPAEHAKLFNAQIQKGAAITAMMGHGNTGLFLSMEHPELIIYDNHSTAALDDPSKISSPLVIFACDCGNFAHPEHASLAATLLLGRGGPVATIAATTESHPLTNYYSSLAMLQTFAEPNIDRVGDLWFAAQRKARTMRKPLIERMLKNVEGSLEQEIDIQKLKRDQVLMYAYLGDPAQTITLPEELEISITKTAEGSWVWSSEKPEGAENLIVQHRPLTEALRSKPDGADREQSLRLFAERNSQFAYKTLTKLPTTGDWSGEIRTPGDLRIIALSKDRIRVATRKLR